MQPLGSRVLVSWYWWSECKESQILQPVIQMKELGITIFPHAISLGEEIRRHGAQAKQVVTAIDHHIDG